MPLPMVHLWVAVQMGEARGIWPSPEFLLGSIAPDAVHMRPGYERVHKRRSHLQDPRDTEEHDRVRAFVQEHAVNSLSDGGEGDVEARDVAGSGCARFAAGYAAHILTDRLWNKRVIVPFRERNAHLSREDQNALYYRETDQLDFNLYRRSPWRERVWQALYLAVAPDEVVAPDAATAPGAAASDAVAVPDATTVPGTAASDAVLAPDVTTAPGAAASAAALLVTSDEVDQWRRRTLRWFTELKEEPGIVPGQITDEIVAEFVQEASAFVAERLAAWGVKTL